MPRTTRTHDHLDCRATTLIIQSHFELVLPLPRKSRLISAGDRFPLILVTGMFPDHRRSVMYRLFVLGRHHQGRNTECSQLRLQRHPSTPGKHIRYMFLIVHGQVALAFVHPYHWLVVTTLSCQISIALDVDGLCHHSIEKDEGISYSACIEEHSHP